MTDLRKSIASEIRALMRLIYHRIYISTKLKKSIKDQFCVLIFDSPIVDKVCFNTNVFWLGIPLRKCPMDLWIYQEIIHHLEPDIIIECGTSYGGSALFLASICDLVNNGTVITIDIEDIANKPRHKRIKYLHGSSTSQEIVEQIQKLIAPKDKVMVILDSDHHKEHVLDELRIYSQFVTKGSYLIVEDTVLNGHPVRPDFGPGPMEAVEEFLKENKIFTVDQDKEKFYVTFNPKGYLRKLE